MQILQYAIFEGMRDKRCFVTIPYTIYMYIYTYNFYILCLHVPIRRMREKWHMSVTSVHWIYFPGKYILLFFSTNFLHRNKVTRATLFIGISIDWIKRYAVSPNHHKIILEFSKTDVLSSQKATIQVNSSALRTKYFWLTNSKVNNNSRWKKNKQTKKLNQIDFETKTKCEQQQQLNAVFLIFQKNVRWFFHTPRSNFTSSVRIEIDDGKCYPRRRWRRRCRRIIKNRFTKWLYIGSNSTSTTACIGISISLLFYRLKLTDAQKKKKKSIDISTSINIYYACMYFLNRKLCHR